MSDHVGPGEQAPHRITHYAVIVFIGDPFGEHDDEQLNGSEPSMTLLGQGGEAFCWHAIERWTKTHPLRAGETAEVLARDPSAYEHPTPPPTSPT